MVDDNDGKLKTELLTKTIDLCDKIGEDYEKISKKTDVPLAETFKKCKKCLDYIDNKKTDLILLHAQIKEKPANSWNEFIGEIIKHETKVLSLFIQIKKIISKKFCPTCHLPLPNSLHIYQNNSLKQWTIKNPFNLEDTFIAFCSENCFKQSIYYQANQQSNTHTHTHTHKNSQLKSTQNIQSNQTKNYILCQNCTQEINSTYYYQTKKPHIKLCSEKCYNEYYSEFCLNCKNKFLDIYRLQETDPCGYCLNCYQEQLKKKPESEQRKQLCGVCQKELFGEKEKWRCICDLCVEKQFREAEREAKVERERREHNAKFRENNLVGNNQVDELKREIGRLEKQSFVGDQNSPNPNQSLLNSKKAELRNLEKRLNQQTEQKQNKSKLILGISLGILGLGLVGILVWLIFRKKELNV